MRGLATNFFRSCEHAYQTFFRQTLRSITCLQTKSTQDLATCFKLLLQNLRTCELGLNPICICGGDIESMNNFFLRCPEYCKQGKPSLTTFKALIKCY